MATTTKPSIPLDKMTEEAFAQFKEQYLNDDKLSKEAIIEIKKLIGVDPQSLKDNTTGRIACDEAHGHRYECNQYYVPITGLVHRLLTEISRYENKGK